MGFLDSLLRRGPGLIAAGLAGQQKGQDLARQRGQEDQQNMIRMALLQKQLNPPEPPADFQIQQVEDGSFVKINKRTGDVQPLGIRAPQKPAPLNPVDVHAANRRYDIDNPLPKEPTPRNIDPLSPEGIAAQLRLKAATGGGGEGGKIMPASAVSSIAGQRNILRAAEEASTAMQGAIDKKQNVTGPLTGRMTWLTEALGKTNPDAISVRAKLANVTSEIMKQRSGGAITPSEFVRLTPFLAGKNDREEVAAQKLTDLIAYLKSNMATTEDEFQSAGYRTPEASAAKPRKYKENPYP